MEPDNNHMIKNSQKQPATPEQTQKYQQIITKKRAHIEKNFCKSTVNKLYIFPRTREILASDSSESQGLQQIGEQYNLKSQNQKSRKNQVHLGKISNKSKWERTRQIGYNSTRSAQSLHSVEEGGKTLKNKKQRTKNVEISLDTRKKTPHKVKTSQSKLLVEQYSLDNRAYGSTKKPSKGLLISFRGTKNQDINVSFSGKRVKTEIS